MTTNYYDAMGRVWKTTLPDNTSVTNGYFTNGLLRITSGSRTYPVAYTYDYAGRMKTMTTWTNFANNLGAAVTTWNYDGCCGWLTNKVYDGNAAGPFYTYTAAGRLQTRLWARNITTTYTYDSAGSLTNVAYSDGITPSVATVYDRLDRASTITQTLGGTSSSSYLAYNGASELIGESFTGGPLGGVSLTNRFDQYLRRTNLVVQQSLNPFVQQSFGYDGASRLRSVSDGNNSATYKYLANSPLVENIYFTNNGTLRMTTTKAYDNLNRLLSISSVSSVGSVANFNYAYNAANQRTAVTNADSAHWIYHYDPLGQVISGKKYWNDGTPVAGEQFEYAFDDIGNRTSTKAGGDASGSSLRQASYSANTLNQYTSRTVPGYLNVLGSATNTATVTVNTQPVYRRTNYFRAELPVDNASAPVWLSLTNVSVLNNGTNDDIIATNIGGMLLPQTPEGFTYDADGNLTSDGLWTNTWNAENQLIATESRACVPAASRKREQWTYLSDGRWIERVVSTNNGSSYFPHYTNRFVWDGRVLLAVLDHTNGLVMSFTRGLDLSGSPQGAGGVGGLLAVKVGPAGLSGMAYTTHFAAFDGNGNVSALVNAVDGSVSARYEYGPFGETIRMSGPMAKVNPIRFSTQYADDVTDDLKYLYREYTPTTGKWKIHDPEYEEGGANLYGLLANNAIDRVDYLGKKCCLITYQIGNYTSKDGKTSL